ncbi:MAG: aminotransferase class V-fold PLP-dependent enzyme [Deltaproteobacteria bacterium]|nr:aminotransferase class V-fold PLP-dependent enzyme [Deltaproteobacteria bacterium]
MTHERNAWFRLWTLDPEVIHLNHGSFGATPLVVQERQSEFRARLERDPMRFFLREYESFIEESRAALAAFVNADPDGLAFVDNATSAVNAVLRSLQFGPGDEIVITNHGYNACNNAARYVADRAGARVVVADVPFPVASEDAVFESIVAAVTPRTRIAVIDHVTSPTALIFPIERLVRELDRRGVDTLVDGAHALGMLPLDLDRLGAAYYTANAHKWLCTPKGAAFLHVRADRRDRVRPLVISHGANAPVRDRSRLCVEFDWTGTRDPSAWLAIPACVAFLESLMVGGIAALMRRNHDMAVRARNRLAAALGVAPPCPISMLGSMAALPLPPGIAPAAEPDAAIDPLQDLLEREHRITVPIIAWPGIGRLVRVSMHVYNDQSDIDALADALSARVGRS